MNFLKVIIDCFVCISLMTIMIVVIVGIFPQLGLSFLPKEVQNKCTLRPMTKNRKTAAYILYAVLGIAFVAYLFYMIVAAYRAAITSYWIIFLHFFIVINIVHLFDVIILDWLIIAKITPKFLYKVFPGTEDCPGYKEFGFNKMEHVKNFAGTAVGSLALAGIAYGVMKWLVW